MEKGKISALQMALLLYPTVTATAILSIPGVTAGYAQQDLWLSPIIASLAGFSTVFIAVRLHKFYPGQTIILISEQIAGSVFGKMIGFLFLFFYIQATGLVIRPYSEFIIGFFLFTTPISVIIVSMALLCAFAVYGGIEVVARTAELFSPLFILPILLLIILLIPELELENSMPILEKGVMPPLKGAIMPSGWFAESFLIAFLLPFLADSKKAMKYGMFTVLAISATLAVTNFIVFAILGPATATKSYPLMMVGRYISYADFFENLESVIMAVWIVGAFVKITVFFYAAALGTAQWLNLSDYRPVIWPVGILIVQFSFWSLPSTMAMAKGDLYTFPFYSVFIQIVLPLLLLLLAVIKKRKKRE